MTHAPDRRAAGLVVVVLLAVVREPAHAARLGRLRRPPIGGTVAVNTSYGAPREPLEPAALARLAAAGVRRIRNDLDWASIERTPGVYDFATPGFDALVAAAEAAGLRLIFILDEPIRHVAQVRPHSTVSTPQPGPCHVLPLRES